MRCSKAVYLCLVAIAMIVAGTTGFSDSAETRLAIPRVDPAEQICFVLYTCHEGILQLTAQLYPLPAGAAGSETSGEPPATPSRPSMRP